MTATLPSAAVLGARAFAALAGLNRFTDEPGKLTRLYLSPAHRQAAEWTKGAMEVAGLAAFIDGAGSVQGRREGARPGLPAVLIAAMMGGFWPGMVATVLSSLASWFFLLEPAGRFSTLDAEHLLGLVLFFITFVVLALSKLLLARLKKNEGARA